MPGQAIRPRTGVRGAGLWEESLECCAGQMGRKGTHLLGRTELMELAQDGLLLLGRTILIEACGGRMGLQTALESCVRRKGWSHNQITSPLVYPEQGAGNREKNLQSRIQGIGNTDHSQNAAHPRFGCAASGISGGNNRCSRPGGHCGARRAPCRRRRRKRRRHHTSGGRDGCPGCQSRPCGYHGRTCSAGARSGSRAQRKTPAHRR